MSEKLIPGSLNTDFAKRLWRRAISSVPQLEPTPLPSTVPQVIVGGWDNGIWRSLNVGLVHRACEKLLEGR